MQLLGVVVIYCCAFGVTWVLLKLLNFFFVLRVSPEEEELGLNVSEHQAKTDTYELFQVMDLQARTNDLSLRVPVESFTEVGHIATRYNQVMDALQKNHQQNVESLEELYAVTATVISSVENQKFFPEDFASFANRSDELGILARVLQQMVKLINNQQQELDIVQKQLQGTAAKQQNLIIKILKDRFPDIPESTTDYVESIHDLDQLSLLLQKAIAIPSLEEFPAE